MRTAHPSVAIPLTILCTLVAAIGGTLPAMSLLDDSNPLAPPAAALGVAVIAVLLVSLWRRFLLRRPWRPWERPKR